MTNQTDERNWTPPDPEERSRLFDQYNHEGHFGILEARYTSQQATERAKAKGWPAAHTEEAPADAYQPFCFCGAHGPEVTGWRTARQWIRDHRAAEGLDRQVFISEDRDVSPEFRDHEVWVGLDRVARDQGLGGWYAFCECEKLNEDEGYLPSYRQAIASAAHHAAENDGYWDEGHPETEEEYERIG